MRPLSFLLVLGLLALAGAARAGIPEGEPNDDPDDPAYAGDLGTLGASPLAVDGTIDSYAFPGDPDFHRFTLPLAATVTLLARGIDGQPDLQLLDAAQDSVGATVRRSGDSLFLPGTELLPGTYFAVLRGGVGPSADDYELSIRTLAEAPLSIQKAKVRFNPAKGDRDTGSVVAAFTAPGLDPAADGLFIRYFGAEWYLRGDSFTMRKGKHVYKGPKGDFLKKVQVDPGRGIVKIKLGKGGLGDPGARATIDLRLESGGVSLTDEVDATARNGGKLLRYKAPR